MKRNIAELVDRVRPQAGMPLIVCECPSPTPPDETAWLWVFRENAANQLQQRWAGVLTRPEIDEFVSRLREQDSVWLGGIDTHHGPPSKRFRLVWTLPPAPCRIYTRRGLAIDAESPVVTRHLFWRREQFAVQSSSVVEGWISRDWTHSGISLNGDGGEEWEVVRLKNAGPFMQFLLMYDGIDLLVDTGWLDRVVPRVAEVLGAGWKIVDFTVTPPEILRQSGPALAPATSNE
jgi:hypothetical protein